MVRKLQKTGKSSALIIPKPILELLGVLEGGEVKLTVEKSRLIVEAATGSNPQAQSTVVEESVFNKALDDSMREFSETYKKLAE